MELMSPDVPNVSLCGQPEGRMMHTDIMNGSISAVKEIDIMDTQENNIYRPTDEPEPWDLIQLNVQASVMCLTSKIKTFCTRIGERRKSIGKTSINVTEKQLRTETTNNHNESEVRQKDCNVLTSYHDRTSPAKSKVCVSEAQNINCKVTSQNPTVISSSVGSDCSQTSSRSGTSSLGVARTGESQRSSCSATPDVSPCEEDSGIGLERAVSEVERTDCISEGGLSVDEDKREDLLPLDKIEVRRGEKEDQVTNSEPRYVGDITGVKSGKLESIMEQSLEDLGTTLDETKLDSSSQTDLGVDLAIHSRENIVSKKCDSTVDTSFTTLNSNGANSSSSKNTVITEPHKQQGKESEMNSNNQSDINCDKKDMEVKAGIHSHSLDREQSNDDNSQENITDASGTERSKQQATGERTPEEVDWVGEVRPSMKKLKQAMDGLMRTGRLVHSVFRLQQTPEAAQQAHKIKYRRDICFSQALTALVTSLMTRLWCRKADPLFVTVLAHLGPLAEFECLLTCHGNNEGMLGDMVVAVEDLGTVEFVLVAGNGRRGSGRSHSDGTTPPSPPPNLPTPHISGNRCGVRVVLPVPEHVLSLLPSPASQQPDQHHTFCVTPVLFNIGINEEVLLRTFIT